MHRREPLQEGHQRSVLKEALETLIADMDKMYIWSGDEYAGGDPALPIHINFLLDEFKNIGEIPNFLTILATSRKYRIGSHVVIQGIDQLKTMYKENEWGIVPDNCDTTLFLGVPDIDVEDKEYIQKALGKTTILQKSTSSSKTGVSTSYTPTQVVMSFMQNQPEAKTKGIIMALAGIVMTALKSILQSIGVVA